MRRFMASRPFKNENERGSNWGPRFFLKIEKNHRSSKKLHFFEN